MVCSEARAAGAVDAVVCEHWAKGGAGAVDLAQAVVKACEESGANVKFRYLYDLEKGIVEKIETIAREMYGAEKVELSEEARRKVEVYTRQVSVVIWCGVECDVAALFGYSRLNHPSFFL